jgi:hypothetical protein
MKSVTRRAWVVGVLLTLALASCGFSSRPAATAIPVSVLATNGMYQGSGAIRAATSMAQLKALIFAPGSVLADCPRESRIRGVSCWPAVNAPSSSLLVVFLAPPANEVAPNLKATLDGNRLSLESSYPASSSSQTRATGVYEMAAVPLSSLPKAVLTVVAPPYDRAPSYGRALVDLRDPLPTPDLPTAMADLTAAIDAAFKDAQNRLTLQNTEFTVVDALGVMHWQDDALDCPRVSPTSHSLTTGYIVFLVKGGVPVSPELEYHYGAGRTHFCGYSR